MPRISVDTNATTPPAPPVKIPLLSQIDDQLKKISGTSMLAAFSAWPQNVTFSDEEENENIILLLRAHIITNVPWILITLLLLLIPLVIFPFLGAAGLPIRPGTGFVFFLLWYLATFTYAFINFLSWYFNVYILTNERVVDIDWYSIIYRKVSSAQISKIQDVSATQIGVLAGIFDYGNIQIQTAAEEENFEFTNIPHPQLVKKKIDELMQKEEKEWEHGPN